ncbi:MAG: hypothetical protein H6831_03955 [Planctomycetes bacterium]|nr:hypothetical protein [Planctomycetota bacterium]MCB9903541.1 hypothetical protein [Planctomycetota bacterium]
MTPIAALIQLARTFGPEAAREKARLLDEVAALRRCSVRELVKLQDAVGFLLAYPDDARVRRGAERVSARLAEWAAAQVRAGRGGALEESGLAGTSCRRRLSFELARWVAERVGAELEVDWDELEDPGKLHDVLCALVLASESPALDDVEIGVREWLTGRARGGRSGLAVLLDDFASLALTSEQRAALFETCEVPLRLDDAGAARGRTELRLPPGRVHYQKEAIPRDRRPLPPLIRRELRAVRRLPLGEARERLATVKLAMLNRDLEIYPLTHADERDVRVIACGRGVEITLVGVLPEQRCAFEALFYYLVTKNGVPIAYGPASPFLGSCEMGINFFEEFRGAEARFVYTQVMRVLHHLLGVHDFYVTPYGMGKGNAAALATGAFWFYRKLGFATSNPEVEALARAEEDRMRARPGYRSDARTLRRLAATAVHLELERGSEARFDSSALARAVTRAFDAAPERSRDEYARRCSNEVARRLGLRGLSEWTADERRALERVAPALALIDELAAWTVREKRALIGIVRAKAGRPEDRAALALIAHTRLAKALRRLCERSAD